METFDSSWWIYYRDKMLFLFSSVQEKLYIFANISHYLLVTIFKLIVRLSLFARAFQLTLCTFYSELMIQSLTSSVDYVVKDVKEISVSLQYIEKTLRVETTSR